MNNRANPIINPDQSRQPSAYPLAGDTKIGAVSQLAPIVVGPQDKSRQSWAMRWRFVTLAHA